MTTKALIKQTQPLCSLVVFPARDPSLQEKAFGDEGLKKLANYGYVQFFRSGEYHHNSPILMKTLHKVGPGRDECCCFARLLVLVFDGGPVGVANE